MPIPPTPCFRCGAQLAPADRDHCATCLGLVQDVLRAYRAYLAALCALERRTNALESA